MAEQRFTATGPNCSAVTNPGGCHEGVICVCKFSVLLWVCMLMKDVCNDSQQAADASSV